MGLNINSVNYDGQTVLHIMSKLGFKSSIDAMSLTVLDGYRFNSSKRKWRLRPG